MRTNSRRPSVVGLIAALALAACQSTPAAPTQTPVNPKDTFATPGAPTPFLPTMTPVPSPTARPTATAVPPTAVPATATVAVPTLAPTKGATPTPTPLIVNGQPKMWWVDQMVKQADGSFMAPEAVRQAIRETALMPYLARTASPGKDSFSVAKAWVESRAERAQQHYIGIARADALTSTVDAQLHIIISGTTIVSDVRRFSADGLTALVEISRTNVIVDAYLIRDLSLLGKGIRGGDAIELRQVRLDQVDGVWKQEGLVTVLGK